MKIVTILVSLVLSISARTEDVKSADAKTHGYIRQARAHLLKRERLEAAKILLAAIEDQKSNGVTRELLTHELLQVSQIFLTNEGQKNYEMAESLRLSGRAGYLAKYEAAQLSEINNAQIYVAQIMGYFAEKNCKSANIAVMKLAEINPYYPGAEILQFKTALCMSDAESIEKKEQVLSTTTKNRAIAWSVLAEKSFRDKKYEQALLRARESMKQDAAYPTGYYWAWKVLAQNENEGLDEAQTFLSLCKSINANLRKKFYLDPQVCEGQEAVEEFIKKIEGAAL